MTQTLSRFGSMALLNKKPTESIYNMHITIKQDKKRHWKSKHFKPLTEAEEIECEKAVDPANEVQMQGLAKIWYNGKEDLKFWQESIDTFRKYNNKESFRKRFYYEMLKADQISTKLTRKVFNEMFEICFLGYISGWLKKEERSKKKNIDGMAEMDILNHIKGKKSIALDRIIKELPEYDQNTLKGTLTNMTKKGYVVCKEINSKKFYSISDSIAEDEKGWFVR